MSTVPKVSVVMAVYNGLPYLNEAVDSVLNQTFTDFEFIIIDDGSSDGSTEVLRDYALCDKRIHLIKQENRGLTPSLNRGLQEASGKYIARMDADDVCVRKRFEWQVDYLDRHPDCILVGGCIEPIDRDGNPILPSGRYQNRFEEMNFLENHKAIEKRLLEGGWAFAHPAVMMHRSAIEKVGGYDEQFRTSQDRDLFLRLAESGIVANQSHIVLKYRCHESQVSTASTDQRYWSKRARRAGYRRRGLPLPKELRFPAMLQTAIGKELRKLDCWPRLLRLYNQLRGV